MPDESDVTLLVHFFHTRSVGTVPDGSTATVFQPENSFLQKLEIADRREPERRRNVLALELTDRGFELLDLAQKSSDTSLQLWFGKVIVHSGPA